MNKKKKFLRKTIKLLGVVLFMAVALAVGFPSLSKIFNSYHIDYFNYSPATQAADVLGTTTMPPAVAVPVLMYHGVLKDADADNTQQDVFTSHMEMLKDEGFETITLSQLYAFFQGKFTLPPKPIVITFDDGRKDSFYPTDDILKTLGFKASIFVVTGKQKDEAKFFLSWDDLIKMRDSKRWEIEAHGAQSHDTITIDEKGNRGRFLTSKKYIPGKGLETDEEFTKRIENDYIQNIQDFKKHLNIVPQVYAIPLNEYGNNVMSNFPKSGKINAQIIRKYYKMALIEAYSGGDPEAYSAIYNLPVYNYADQDPYFVTRVEPKNMSAQDLKAFLEKNAPKFLPFALGSDDLTAFENNAFLEYGKMDLKTDGLHLLTTPGVDDSAKVIFGDSHWSNYQVQMQIRRLKGRSVVLEALEKDKNNYIAFGLTDNGIFLREIIDGIEKPLVKSVTLPFVSGGPHKFRLTIRGNTVNAYYDSYWVFRNVKTKLTSGRIGFKVWDDKVASDSVLQSLSVDIIK